MTLQQTWVIGAAPDCDIVIDEPSVSGQHCRISQSGQRLIIEDLGSRNGTYVNGRRLDGPARLIPGSSISLGPDVAVPPEKLPAVPGQVIRIGRQAGNDVVIDESMISGNHAVLRIANEGLVLEDLGSTNGTAVGDGDNRISSAAVKPSDVVYFGSYSASVERLIEMSEQSPSPRAWTSIAIVAGVAATLILIGFVLSRGSAEPDSLKPVAASRESTSTSDPPGDSLTDSGSRAPNIENGNSVEVGVVEDPGASLYSVVIDPTGSEVGIRLGMAWPVDRRTLVTTGSVALFLKRHTDRYLHASVRNEATGQEFPILRAVPHSDFEHFQTLASEVRKQADELRQKIESAADVENPPTESELAKLVDDAVKAESQWFDLTERQTDSDVGLISATGLDESAVLPFAATVPEAGQLLHVYGTPFTTESSVVEPDLPLPVQSPSGEAVLIESRRGLTSNRRIAVNLPEPLVELHWTGSPVVNARNSVVGVVVRRTPPGVPGEEATPNRFDILLTTTLSDFISDFNKP